MAVEPLAPPFQLPDELATGGRIGPEPEDFRVDEIPLYAAGGEGQHHYVRVEKRSLTTDRLVQLVARAAGVSPAEVGSSGMKDKHAITTQWLSVPATAKLPPEAWELPEGVRLLEATRHDNKLRTGHLLGNQFRIRVVESSVGSELEQRLAAAREALRAQGLRNFFGAQRFGMGGGNLERALDFARRGGRLGRFEAKLYPSVLQSEAFNRYLELRRELGFAQLIEGEVVRLAGSGAHFVVEDVAREQPRLNSGDLVLTGPMFGPKGRQAARRARELEEQALSGLGLDESARARLGKLAPGARRDLMVPLEAFEVETSQPGSFVLSFELPAGSYATQLVREFTRTEFLADPRAGRAASFE